MKKIVFSTIALLAVFACTREIEAPVQTQADVKTHTVVITAGFDALTKTAYDAQGKFAWVAGDKIGVITSKEVDGEVEEKVVTFTTQDAGPVATFTGEVEEGFEVGHYATYPYTQETEGYACNDFVYDPAKKGFRLWGSIKPSLEDPLSNVPLLATKDAEGTFQFSTATGIVKFTVSNLPASTAFAFFKMPDKADGNLNGWYFPSDDGTIEMSNALENLGYKDKYNWNVPAEEGATLDYYFFIPQGTIPAGTVFALRDEGWNNIKTYTFLKDVQVVRNEITNIAPLKYSQGVWTSLGKAKFIDTFVWAENNFTMEPVEAEVFYHPDYEGEYKMANPYAIAAAKNGVEVEGADDEFFFRVITQGRISHDWLNMGLPLSKNAEKTWAMISGQDVAEYGSDLSHVVSYTEKGAVAQVQIAPCYRTSDELKEGEPTDYANEIGKDHNNGIIEIAFPGHDLLMPVTIPSERISVSANQSNDGQGAPGLIDSKLSTFWHTPWSAVDENADPVYGQYVTVKLPEKATKLAFNYCTRQSVNQNGAPAMVVVGGSKDGKTYTEIATYEFDYMTEGLASATWVGLPEFDAKDYVALRFGIAKNYGGYDLREITSTDQWCNLSELMIYGITTGEELEIIPDWLEDGQLYVKSDAITVNSNAGTYSGGLYDGIGVPGLVDGNIETYWHSSYYAGYASSGYYDTSIDFDPVYGITIDMKLPEVVKDFHVSYYVRHNNNNGRPREIKLAGSHDGETWTLLKTIADDTLMDVAAKTRVDLPAVQAAEAYEYLRIGITKSGNNSESLTAIADGAKGIGSTALGEILLFTD